MDEDDETGAEPAVAIRPELEAALTQLARATAALVALTDEARARTSPARNDSEVC
jgi:hypothetical protein